MMFVLKCNQQGSLPFLEVFLQESCRAVSGGRPGGQGEAVHICVFGRMWKVRVRRAFN